MAQLEIGAKACLHLGVNHDEMSHSVELDVTVKAKGKKIVESSVSDSLYGGEKPELQDVDLTMIPYPYWNNRGEGEMLVWHKLRV